MGRRQQSSGGLPVVMYMELLTKLLLLTGALKKLALRAERSCVALGVLP